MDITFLLNGESVHLSDVAPTRTLLDWLREERGLTGTKEGCNEGDCGACTVVLLHEEGTEKGFAAVNACITFLPQLHGKAVRTVEGMAAPDGTPHPVQEALVTHHGSQCGFCTPGFVTSLVAAGLSGDDAFDDVLAGNLCRCTGYAPIIRAAQSVDPDFVPDWMEDILPDVAPLAVAPESSDDLAAWYAAHPEATLIAGATDVGLWVTKALRELGPVVFLNRCWDLQQITLSNGMIRVGAGATIAELRNTLQDRHPHFADMLRRFASTQIRNTATIGGNIANGSPIGDGPPPLIALGARVHLRKGDSRRDIPLEDFFLEYGKQDRTAGEFVEAISIPEQPDHLRVYKLSKRFDQDISAVLGAFNIHVENGIVLSARIAFGGMAGVPKRAHNVEDGLIGQPWSEETLDRLDKAWAADFTPMSDMRASADYRLTTAKNLLQRCLAEEQGHLTNVLEVRP